MVNKFHITLYNIMLSYCWKYRKNTDGKNPKVAKTKKRENNAFIKIFNMW